MDDREKIWYSQQGFIKDKSCLTDPVAFSDGVTPSLDKGRASHVIYLDFCKTFNMIPPNTFLSALDRDGFDG